MASDRRIPPALAKCVDCGCCYAELYADDAPICWACDAGEPCAAKKRAAAKTVLATPNAAVKVAPESKKVAVEAKAAPVQEATVGTKSRHGNRKIPDEVRAAILAADPSIKHAELARKYGISDVTVYTIRKNAGITVARKGAKPGKKPSAAWAKTAKPPRVFGEFLTEVATATIELRLTPVQMDNVWGTLTVASKAIAIAAALQAGL